MDIKIIFSGSYITFVGLQNYLKCLFRTEAKHIAQLFSHSFYVGQRKIYLYRGKFNSCYCVTLIVCKLTLLMTGIIERFASNESRKLATV